ncbi:MAG: arginine--tRNA ligase [Saezia sp.]
MLEIKQELLNSLQEQVNTMTQSEDTYRIQLEVPKQIGMGDFACTIAMQLAKPMQKSPRDIATQIMEGLKETAVAQQWVESIDIAGPGFINIKLKPQAKQRIVASILHEKENFGIRNTANSAKILVEFVSANPTGPLHVGHGRQATLGDAICNVMETQGWQVTREFYYNDAGVQIQNLTLSVQARAKGLSPESPNWPESAYNGEYIADIAKDFLAKKTVTADDRSFMASGDIEDVDSIRQFAVAYLRHEQDQDLKAFSVHFDNYYLESSLYTSGKVDAAVERLKTSGYTYEQDGALWFRSTDFTDDKDRVMRKQDGSYTYFVPDVAYHLDKWQRGFVRAINIQGSDHHGTIARVRAGIQAANPSIPTNYPDYILHKMVTVMRDGQEVKISKRAGSYVTLRDLIDWTSKDAVRFFLISRKADTEFVFDIDLALKQNDENPVFYVQYAHARICTILRKAEEQKLNMTLTEAQHLHALNTTPALLLMNKLAQYPDMLTTASSTLSPHDIAFYLRDLASAFHSYYDAERVLVDDVNLAQPRLALLNATRQVFVNALNLLGVSAPTSMNRHDGVS